MGYPDITFRTELPHVVRKELELYSAQVAGFLSSAGFRNDGSFVQQRADTIDTDTLTAGSVTAGTLTVAGDMTLDDVWATTVTAQALRLSTQSSYVPSPGDTTALNDASSPTRSDGSGAPLYSAYRLVPTANRTIAGIYVEDLTNGARGHVLVLWNDSVYSMVFDSTGIITNQRKILNGPWIIGPQGCIVFLHDTNAQGWRHVASHFGDRIAYTPTWTGAGSNPAIGDGALSGAYTVSGKVVHFKVSVSMGSTTTYGTGEWSFTIPATSAAITHTALGSAVAVDSGTAYYTGTTYHATTTTVKVITSGSATAWAATVPFTWASGDSASFEGTYELA